MWYKGGSPPWSDRTIPKATWNVPPLLGQTVAVPKRCPGPQRQPAAAKNDVFANCDQKQPKLVLTDLLILCGHHSAAADVDVDMRWAAVASFVLTSVGERPHPTRALTGQWLLTVHAGDIEDQRTCSTLLIPTPRRQTVCEQ